MLWRACQGDALLEGDMGHRQVGNIFKSCTSTSIEFMHKAVLERRHTCRIGHVYMTQGAMELFVKELIRHHGRLLPTRRRLLLTLKAAGNRLWGLLPDKTLWWACLVDDILASSWWRSVRKELLKECTTHKEFTHLTMDATLRIL